MSNQERNETQISITNGPDGLDFNTAYTHAFAPKPFMFNIELAGGARVEVQITGIDHESGNMHAHLFRGNLRVLHGRGLDRKEHEALDSRLRTNHSQVEGFYNTKEKRGFIRPRS